MRKWWKAGFLLFVITILMSSLVACNFGKSNDNEKKLEKVRIAEVTRSIFYAPQYVAIEKGFFEEEGLDIELMTTFGGDKTMTTLVSGGADIALVGSETSIYVSAQGSTDPVINFAHIIQNIIQVNTEKECGLLNPIFTPFGSHSE